MRGKRGGISTEDSIVVGRYGQAPFGVAARHGLIAVALALALPAVGAERDICENRTGVELIRCIEAAARGEPPSAGQSPSQPAAPGKAARPLSRAAPAAPAAAEPPRPPAEDCTGLAAAELRRCLAAGGRLAPEAAVLPSPSTARATPGRYPGCEGKHGEALRACIQAQDRTAPQAAQATVQPRVIPCTGYTRADQPLCLHRNTAIAACRNRSLYPDFDVCMRSHMASAPDLAQADCKPLKGQAREHCEARNRVYARCSSDKMDYFACLERQLGADAVLTRR